MQKGARELILGGTLREAPIILETETAQIEDILDKMMQGSALPVKVVLTKGTRKRYVGTLVAAILRA